MSEADAVTPQPAADSPAILLVDDEAGYVDTLAKRLARRGYRTTTATDGPSALAILESPEESPEKSAVDVVVLDVRMPGMDGIETLRRIKALAPTIEVVMLTGHASVEAAMQGMELGAFDYLMKPVELDDLLYKIQDAWKKKQLHEGRLETVAQAAQAANKSGATS